MSAQITANPDHPLPSDDRQAGQTLPPARYNRAFIVTYGRSGSTLLQGVLNALPGYLIRGENYDALGKMNEFYKKLPRHERRKGAPGKPATTPENPFYGFERFSDENVAAALRRFLDFLLAGDAAGSDLRCLGFKEIRYHSENVSARVDFLRMLYPGCAIIYNTRKPEDVVASEFQRNKEAALIAKLNAVLEDLNSVDRNSFLVRYEDVVAGSGTLRGLYRFLGENFDQKSFEAVLQKKHSYHTVQKGTAYSNAPASIRVTKKLDGVEVFIMEKVESEGDTTKLQGFLLEAAGAPQKRFTRLADEESRDVAFTAQYNLASPRLAKRLGNEAAAKARFNISFTHAPGGELRLFLDNDELAAVVSAARAE